ncbi:MAG: flavin reductase family protein, partial [Candidatus Rokuibacteriota bacterium]
ILVCVSQKAQSYPAIKAAGCFAVNILSQGQEIASRRFATSTTAPADEKFAGVEYRPGPLGLPVLADALAELECTVVHAYPGGDHTIFVAQVETADCRADAGKEPLLYFRGKYSRLHA